MNRQTVETVFDAINAAWRSASLQVDDHATASVWWMAIEDIPQAVVAQGVVQLARSEARWPPTPGQFRRMCQEIRAANQRRQEERELVNAARRADQQRAARSPRDEAWALTQVLFARRGAQGFVKVPAPEFDTDFDGEYVAMSVPIPAGDGLLEHQDAFADLKAVFEREWQRHSAGAAAETFA